MAAKRFRITAIILIVVYISCGVITANAGVLDWIKGKPKLDESQTQWHSNTAKQTQNIAKKLLVTSEGYKMVKAYRQDGKDKVEWGWKMDISSLSDKRIFFQVDYFLVDTDGFTVSRASGKYMIDSSEYELTEITVQGTQVMDYEDMERVHKSSWLLTTSDFYY
jgi:hypothetical protein